MFKSFKKKFVKVNKGKIFCRFKGNGPPLLLLHGYPQSHVMWHKTAPELSKQSTSGRMMLVDEYHKDSNRREKVLKQMAT